MTIDVSEVVVPCGSIARLLDRLESADPLVPTPSNLESTDVEVSPPRGGASAGGVVISSHEPHTVASQRSISHLEEHEEWNSVS